MSKGKAPTGQIGPVGPMYFVDLLEYLEERNRTSFQEAFNLIHVVRRYGPEVAKAKLLGEDLCEARTHIGYGLEVVIEMDRDRNGAWQPVLGKIVKQ